MRITNTQQLTIEEQKELQEIKLKTKPYNENTNYLGIWLDKFGTFKKHKNSIISKTYYQLIQLRKILCKKIPINLTTLQIIYNSKARSRIEYGLIIHSTPRNLETFQKIQNNFLRMILNVPKTTPIELLHFIIQEPTIKEFPGSTIWISKLEL